MGLLAWIIVGLVAGWLATALVPGESGGLGKDLIVGIIGAIIGGWLFNASGAGGVTGVNLWSILVAVVGAVILLIIVRAATARRV